MKTFINQNLYPGEFLLHQKYCQSEMLLDLVWTHGNIIADIALSILERGQFDKQGLSREFIIQSSLLMDIGTYLCGGYEWLPGQPLINRPHIHHHIVGAWILFKENYSPPIIQVAHTHSGVGINNDDVRNFALDLPAGDYQPRTQLQKLVAFSNQFHNKTPKFQTVAEIRQKLNKFGREKIERFDQWLAEFGPPQLAEIRQKYDSWHKSFNFQLSQLAGGKQTPPMIG